MNDTLLNTTVGELVREKPGRARVFERYGIDYCCGGKRPLAEACQRRGVDAQAIVGDLRAVEDQPAADERNWSDAPLGELIDHIVATHHAYLRRELPRLAALLEKVVKVHGGNHPELDECQVVFRNLWTELEAHMMKEEHILFPLIAAMEANRRIEAAHCGSVNNPIRVMEAEHDAAGNALARLRALTGDFAPPADACNTYRTVLDSLAELEADLHQHIHKENNILFPRAAALESQLAAGESEAHG